MTLRTNARVAGFTYFVYLAAGIGSLALAGRTQFTGVLDVFASFSALVLGVTLYALTRDQDRDLAMLGLVCRVIEGMPGPGEIYFAVGNAIFCWLLLRGRMIPIALARLGLLASIALIAILLLQRGGLFGSATSWASSATWLVRLPMLVFELWFASWLIVRGVARTT
jgi:hypothetical protein